MSNLPTLTTTDLATKKQTYALYICYKKDFRGLNLSKVEASKLIDAYNKGQKTLPKKYELLLSGLKTDTYKIGTATIIENSTKKVYVKKSNNKSVLYEYLTSNDVATDLISVIGAEFKIGGVLTNDIDKTDKKAYLMLGGGCGFSHIKFDGRNKKVAAIVTESRDIKRKVEAYYMTLIDKNYLAKLEKSGNPIEAHFMQNLSYNTAYNYKVIRYLESLGYKNITATSMLD
jgi:hypothetical protein